MAEVIGAMYGGIYSPPLKHSHHAPNYPSTSTLLNHNKDYLSRTTGGEGVCEVGGRKIGIHQLAPLKKIQNSHPPPPMGSVSLPMSNVAKGLALVG
jgi:hypothetical protein